MVILSLWIVYTTPCKIENVCSYVVFILFKFIFLLQQCMFAYEQLQIYDTCHP
jgi:tellurite resistance protein TehA-like permease